METIEKVLEMLSVYDILNNIIPGAIFIVSVEKLTNVHIQTGDLIFDLALCYFIGLTIGRFGSLVVEGCLKWAGIFNPVSYKEYVKAEAKSKSVRRLLTIGNMYRTYIAVSLWLAFTVVICSFSMETERCAWIKSCIIAFMCFLLTILFSCAFIKQSRYLVQRVHVINNQGTELSKEEEECIRGAD